MDNIVFTCAIVHNMHLENDKWDDEYDEDNIAADIPELSMDERIISIRNGPVDRSFVGSGNIMQCNVEEDGPYCVRIR